MATIDSSDARGSRGARVRSRAAGAHGLARRFDAAVGTTRRELVRLTTRGPDGDAQSSRRVADAAERLVRRVMRTRNAVLR